MTTDGDARPTAAVDDWVGVELDAGGGDIACERGHVLHWLEATANANPLHWDPEVADELAGGWVAPPTMLSVWMRPLLFDPTRDEQIRPLELHFRLKDAFGLPEGIVASNEITFHEPVRPGDVVSTTQTVRSISEPKTTSLGTGRFWTIDVVYTNQDDVRVGVESYDLYAYTQEEGP